MKVGDYVRTKKGTFDRFITSHTQDNLTWYTFEDRGNITNPENYIIKSSPNIIDLIEVGDYVNYGDIMGGLVLDKKDDEITVLTILPSKLKNKDIRSVITREQIESHLYKLEVD